VDRILRLIRDNHEALLRDWYDSSGIEEEPPQVGARDVQVSDEYLTAYLADGRTLAVPTAWYPRLAHGTPQERAHWELFGPGVGIHWADLDEDISIDGLLAGRPSGESERSFRRWLKERTKSQ
jgi:hypothetical protein